MGKSVGSQKRKTRKAFSSAGFSLFLGGGLSPERTCLSTKFPVTGKITGNFGNTVGVKPVRVLLKPSLTGHLGQLVLVRPRKLTGNYFGGTGNVSGLYREMLSEMSKIIKSRVLCRLASRYQK